MESLSRTVSSHNNKYNHNNSSFLNKTNSSSFLNKTNNSSFLNKTNNSSFPSRTNSSSSLSSREITLIVLSRIRSERNKSFSTKTDTDFQLNLLDNSSLLGISSFLPKDNFRYNSSSSSQGSFKTQEIFRP